MSVRAYRVNKISTAKSSTFNLWYDKELMNFIEHQSDFMDSLNMDGNGITEIRVEVLERALAKAKELNLESDTVKAIKRDIAWAKRHDEEYISYSCF